MVAMVVLCSFMPGPAHWAVQAVPPELVQPHCSFAPCCRGRKLGGACAPVLHHLCPSTAPSCVTYAHIPLFSTHLLTYTLGVRGSKLGVRGTSQAGRIVGWE